MEAKLKEYRARRRRQELVEKTTEKITEAKERFVNYYKKMIKINVNEVAVPPAFTDEPAQETVSKKKELEKKYGNDIRNNREIEEQSLIEVNSEACEDIQPLEEKPPETWKYFILKWTVYTVVWVTLYLYFISLQFGAVFFAISLLIGIYLNTGTKPKMRGEVSAYSVFNENCESIDGTLTPEKLQKEMFFGGFRLF